MPISQSLCLVCSRLLPPFESNYKGSKVCTATNFFSHKTKTTFSSCYMQEQCLLGCTHYPKWRYFKQKMNYLSLSDIFMQKLQIFSYLCIHKLTNTINPWEIKQND